MALRSSQAKEKPAPRVEKKLPNWILAVRVHSISKADNAQILKEVKWKWLFDKKYQELPYRDLVNDLGKYEGKKVFVVETSYGYGEYEFSMRTVKIEARESEYVEIPLNTGPSIMSKRHGSVDSLIRDIRSFRTEPQQTTNLKIALSGARLVFLNRTAKYHIRVTNEGDRPVGTSEVIIGFPENLDYISSSPPGIFHRRKQEGLSTITLPLKSIAPQEKIDVEVQLRATTIGDSRIAARLLSKTGEWELEAQQAQLRIIGIPAIHISTYDTEDPIEVGHQTVYVIETRNEGTAPCTNVQLENTIPEQMVFISASPNPREVQGKKVVFPTVPFLYPGDKLTYKIICRGMLDGSAKNVATLRYDQFNKPIIDEEGTSVWK